MSLEGEIGRDAPGTRSILGVPLRLLAMRALLYMLGVPLVLFALFTPLEPGVLGRTVSLIAGIAVIGFGIYVGHGTGRAETYARRLA